MPLDAGFRLGPYEIVSPLGAGGMGEVYKARDARLDRAVAIKILPPALASDPTLHDRFEREAKAVAAISHPNIVAIHDVGRDAGVTFAVMELLDGATLRERLTAAAPHGLPVRTAVDIGVQTARGLAAAHEKGVVHRDLKPENIFVTADGRAKILDFGLAKQPLGAGAAATITPTLPHVTTPGMMLGTVGYMAPEQARGLAVDHRADIFSFGALLYETLSGSRAFPGDTVADTISAILHRDPPDLAQLDPALPPALDRVVRRCLAKNATERFHSAHDMAFALEAAAAERHPTSIGVPAGVALPPTTAARARPLITAAVLTLVGAVIGAGVAISLRRDRATPQHLNLAIMPPDKVDVIDALAVSPDGQSIAFVGVDAKVVARLFVRRLDESSARLLQGTDEAAFPFWAPDGRSLGFFAQGNLKRVDLAGGPPRVLAPVSEARGGTWSKDGVIVFAPNAGDGLYRVSADGGPATRLTTLDKERREVSHRWPVFLPDGKHLVFMNRLTNPDERLVIHLTSLDTPDAQQMRKLVAADSTAMYANGTLFYVRGTTLFARPFDLSRLEFAGEPTARLEHVLVDTNTDGLVAMSVASGTVAARTVEDARTQMTWFDRGGRSSGVFGMAGGADPEMSPDGRALAFDRSADGSPGAKYGLWTADLERGTIGRLGPTLQNDVMPTWSPDGTRIAFSSDRAGAFDLYEKRIGLAPERELLRSPLWKYPESWSPDGKLLLFSQLDPNSRGDLWLLPMDGGKPVLFLGTDSDESQGRFSPDGRWVAYTSDETGRAEVYVRPFPASTAHWQISVDGGTNPLWRRDGGEIFFISPDNHIMSAVVKGGRGAFEFDVPKALFESPRIRRGRPGGIVGGDRIYAVTPRGDRFLINRVTSDMRASAITVILER